MNKITIYLHTVVLSHVTTKTYRKMSFSEKKFIDDELIKTSLWQVINYLLNIFVTIPQWEISKQKLKFKIVSLNPAHGEVYLIQHYFNHRRPRTFKWLNSTKFFFGLPLNKMVKNIIKWAENQVLLFKDHEDSKLFQSIKII
jgi:hypothetical protein